MMPLLLPQCLLAAIETAALVIFFVQGTCLSCNVSSALLCRSWRSSTRRQMRARLPRAGGNAQTPAAGTPWSHAHAQPPWRGSTHWRRSTEVGHLLLLLGTASINDGNLACPQSACVYLTKAQQQCEETHGIVCMRLPRLLQ